MEWSCESKVMSICLVSESAAWQEAVEDLGRICTLSRNVELREQYSV